MAVENADADTIAVHSKDAALVFLPFGLKGSRSVDPFGDPLDKLLGRLPSVTLVLAAEDIDLDADPEEGKAGEIAAALDNLADAEKTAQKAKKNAARASEEYDKQLTALAKAEASETDEENLSKIRNEVFEAEIEAKKAARRFARPRPRPVTRSMNLKSLVRNSLIKKMTIQANRPKKNNKSRSCHRWQVEPDTSESIFVLLNNNFEIEAPCSKPRGMLSLLHFMMIGQTVIDI
jgi:hypothetical protein